MPRSVQARDGESEVVLPNGWALDAGDQVVIPDDTWAKIKADADLLGRLNDLGDITAQPDRVPTWRDIQQAAVAWRASSG